MSVPRTISALAGRLPLKARPLTNRSFSVTLTRRTPPPKAVLVMEAIPTQNEAHSDISLRLLTRVIEAGGKWDPKPGEKKGQLTPFEEIKSPDDLLPPGAEPGTVPTDLEQATGLERLEILGKMQGIDIFDMKPLPSDRVGTFKDPIVVKSAGDELQCGCTGCPADSHVVKWLVVSRARPHERCPECGSVYKMEYVGPPDDPHHEHHGYEEPKTMADYVKPEYWYI